MQSWPGESYDLIYVDPPFNTGRKQTRKRIKTVQDDEGDRVGYLGKRYRTEAVKDAPSGYEDSYGDFLGFIVPRLEEAHRLLKANGSLFVHLDFREVHYVKVELDKIFG